MQKIMQSKLYCFLMEHNPQLLVCFQESNMVQTYLEQKTTTVLPAMWAMMRQQLPAGIIQYRLLGELVKEFPPSRYRYLEDLLRQEFEEEYLEWDQEGTRLYETIKLLNMLWPHFENYAFDRRPVDNAPLRAAIVHGIQQMLTAQDKRSIFYYDQEKKEADVSDGDFCDVDIVSLDAAIKGK